MANEPDEDRIAELQESWEEGLSIAQMATKHGYATPESLKSVISKLRTKGWLFEYRRKETTTDERRDFDKRVLKLVRSGLRRVEIAKDLDVPLPRVNNSIKRLKTRGDLSKDQSLFVPSRSPEENQKLIAMYLARTPLRQIAATFNLGTPDAVSTAIRRLREAGYDIPQRKRRRGK